MFGNKLSELEKRILIAFEGDSEIAFPVGIGTGVDETMKVLLELTKKDIIVGRGPYRLTKLGKRLITEINKENKKEKQD
jgi:hypothetical protein